MTLTAYGKGRNGNKNEWQGRNREERGENSKNGKERKGGPPCRRLMDPCLLLKVFRDSQKAQKTGVVWWDKNVVCEAEAVGPQKAKRGNLKVASRTFALTASRFSIRK